MILLNGHSLTPARRVPLEGMSLRLTERDASASITPADMTGIDSNSWLRDEKAPGAGIVWRVRSIQQAYATRTPTVQLEHAIATLKDRILFGVVKAADISGGTTCTARQAIEYILSQQSDWTLGTLGYSVSAPYKFDGDTLFDALEKVSGSLPDAWWSYDFSTYPFAIHINPRSSGVACELRPGRNLTAISRTVDRSGMYTRFYPIGKEDLHVPGNYISRNENLYGVIAHVETDQSLETVAELTAWANEGLDRHAEPRVTVSADGLELAQATGESLDSLTLGRLCRIPLQEFGTTIEERIVELNYPDKIHALEAVKITMANARQDVTRILAESIKQAARGGGGRAGARQQKEDHAWFEDTDEHVAMCAKGVVGVDAAGNPNWLLLSQIIVDGTGVHQHVQSVQQVSENSAKILEEAGMELDEHGAIIYSNDNVNMVGSKFEVQADKIGMVVGTRTTQSGEENFIKAGEIVLSINQSTGASEAKIDAGHVYIGNDKSTTVIAGKLNASDVTANYIQAKISDISMLSANALTVDGGINGRGTLTVAGLAMLNGSLKFGSGNSFNKCIVSAVKSADGNTLTLTDSAGDVVNFNKAVALSGAWSGMTYSVSATAGTISGTPPSTTIIHQIESTPNVSNTVYSKIYKGSPSNTNLLSSKTLEMTEKAADKYVELTENGTQKGKVSTQTTWNNGWNSVDIASIDVYGSPAASATSISVKAVASNGVSDIGAINITTQRNDAYKKGWNDCIAACTKHADAIYGYTTSNSIDYSDKRVWYGSYGRIRPQGSTSDIWALSPCYVWAQAGEAFKGGTKMDLYEIPAVKT